MAPLIRIHPLAFIPTAAGCAVFLGDKDKAVVITIDPQIAASIQASLAGHASIRPLTHDLFMHALMAFGATVSRVVIVEMKEEIFYARLILEAENEIMQRKIVELDARPSDALALAARAQAPVYFTRELWERLEDNSDLLDTLRQNGDDKNHDL